jgi:hypothetical protein
MHGADSILRRILQQKDDNRAPEGYFCSDIVN